MNQTEATNQLTHRNIKKEGYADTTAATAQAKVTGG